MAWLPEGVTVAHEFPDGGVVLQGPPVLLQRLCNRLGFKNRCETGRVSITAAKVRWLKEQAAK